jgi:PAT family beta-lactamase induction signal transducer AmpG
MDPLKQFYGVVICAILVAFFSASQDIVVDAYRREILPNEELGIGSSLAVLGYRVGTMIAGAGAFILADHMPWALVYAAMAGFMLVGILTTLFCPEPKVDAPPPRTLRESVIGPLSEFFKRSGAWTVLAFVLLYKVGESMASDMYNPFFIQIGFSNTEIGGVAKVFGLWAIIIGGIVGGVLIVRLKLYRSLWLFGALQAGAILLFSVLATVGHSLPLLALAIGAENFTSGMATSAYVAFMALQTNRRFTATQYALLTSLMGVPQALFGSTTGWLADHLGWHGFFVACTLFTIPGLLMLFRLKALIAETEKDDQAARN